MRPVLFSIMLSGLFVSACEAQTVIDSSTGGAPGGITTEETTTPSEVITTGGSTTPSADTTSPGVNCPSDVPHDLGLCNVPEGPTCTFKNADTSCDFALAVFARCVGNHWHVYRPVACKPVADLPCGDFTGLWTVTTTGPYVDPSTGQETAYFDAFQSFDFEIQDEENGLPYVKDAEGALSEVGCTLSLTRTLDEQCHEDQGQVVCATIDGAFDLSLSGDPVGGEASLLCSGDCAAAGTAPVVATRM